MTSPLYLTKSAFAAHRGVSPGYVTKLKEQGRLVFAPDGKKVDVAATEALLTKTADPSKAGVADRHQRDRAERDVAAHIAPSAPDLEPPPSDAGPIDFQKARARREHYLANLREDEYRKAHGLLAEVPAIESAAFATGRMLRDLLLGLPKQIAPELAAISDPWELDRRLTAAIRRALEDAERVSSAELEQALRPPD